MTTEERLAQAIAERDAAVAARDALAGAVREFVVATDAFLADPCASEREYAMARVAALAAAGGAR